MNERSPFDGRMLLAILGVVLLWFGWQSYLQKKYPDHFTKTTQGAQTESAENTTTENATPDRAAEAPSTGRADALPVADAAEKIVHFDHSAWAFDISSKGMAVKNIRIKNYTDRNDEVIVLGGVNGAGNFATNVVGRARPLDFEISRPEENKFVGVAQVGDTRIIKTIIVDSDKYVLDHHVRVDQVDENFSGFVTEMTKPVMAQERSFFLAPSYEYDELFVSMDSSYERNILSPDTAFSQSYNRVSVSALASQYFAVAVVDASDIKPELKAVVEQTNGASQAKVALTHLVPGSAREFAIRYTSFAGPKSFELLTSINSELANVVNFGFFQSIGKLIFKLMRVIHSVIGNWGFAIILLTILVRIIVLPFNIMSYKSMKAMAKIQPQIKLLRERYKNDTQKLNEEMLKLMKEAKANPLGGCLPMLLQIPVFFALYQVLGQSIELYKAPFVLWIHDLSVKDPFFVLPVLMGLTLFIQQKITPTTLEPAQQKVMMFMPVLFSLFMLTLPSGLTLYIFVNGLFGVLQQLYFMRDEKPKATA